jgi:hypothetical protein
MSLPLKKGSKLHKYLSGKRWIHPGKNSGFLKNQSKMRRAKRKDINIS